MEQLSHQFDQDCKHFNQVLGVGRNYDLISRDLCIGGRKARIWVLDGYGDDSVLERMNAF